MTEKNGPLVGLGVVNGDEDIMLITDQGVMIRFAAGNVSETGRSTLGVHLIRVDDDSTVATMAIVQPEEDGDEDIDSETTDDKSGADDQPE